MYDPSKAERIEWHDCMPGAYVREVEFDACAAALTEARAELAARMNTWNDTMALLEFEKARADALEKQRDEALRIVKEYRTLPSLHSRGEDMCISDEYGDDRCPICIAADEALGGE